MHREFREALLNQYIEQGLTIDEMIKKAELTAEILEAGQEKQANPAATAGGAAGLTEGILQFLTDRLGRTSDTLIQGATNIVSNAAPTALVGSAVLPIAAGYYGGDMLAKMTDPGKSRLEEIKKREEIAELKAQTARLRRQRKQRELSV